MSRSMYTKNLISLIEKHEHSYPHNRPTGTRRGYAGGLLGFFALFVDDSYTAEEFKETIRGYVATLRQEITLVESDEVIAKLSSREVICYDILFVLSELELIGTVTGKLNVFNGMDSVVDKNVCVNENVGVIMNKTVDVTEESMDADEFVNVTESDAGVSEADSTEWEIV
ncbi:hypothetical protein NEUTE1DRAFT_102633 [Neurospora tetrasperma FGSC 2508]|uniref:Uncharacterized protein n=1 Tax=Neurospora tetrasperma (strain FGSC 2508 / ATCC MYA-4615 / P0657) TaxID=510951 RepID=F8MT48_NEUT8|nr:uncharacterized protein NEUTE1DRAFT_102633 [Neurospora tetrasperma FGSC 2508]EGO55180.1 hypothetical protein NEUTE1DRAFT_102633 [Neurospora tetrasperma FGSC 2508]EGZ69604.1 hypothetical protein NEUTE2DRAFT_70771 [Neurospora tetrasperma FGSC 2509]